MQEDSMDRVWKGLPQRSVIWALLGGLIGVVGYVGSIFSGRLEALEAHKNEQNGSLNRMDRRLERIEVNIEWIMKRTPGLGQRGNP